MSQNWQLIETSKIGGNQLSGNFCVVYELYYFLHILICNYGSLEP